MVTEWTVRGHFAGAKVDVALPDEVDGWAPDAYAAWEAEHDLGVLLSSLPDGQRRVAEAVYRYGLTPGEAADRLGIEPNAAYQRLHNAHKALRPRLRD
jgi:DNA-directed RNA polymerase specialized sigma24 family protein